MKRFAIAAALVAASGPAFAGFEVEEPTTRENSFEMEITNTFFLGDVNAGDPRSEHEIGVQWGVLHGWTTGFSFELTNEAGASMEFEGIEWSNKIGILGGEMGAGDDAFSLALYASFEMEFDASSDIGLTLGPAIGYEAGDLELTLNPFVTVPLGGGDETGARYAVSAMWSVQDELAVGIEAHGNIDAAFSNAPSLSQQEHFIGPAVSWELELPEDREIEFRFGAFLGLTQITPTVGLSLNMEIGF